ncbi:hypothetical protein KSS87_022611 [Heliosperma pusillum]|nr:hypothetical protein KSS87_022611 [Heliosperma pusillum]
MATSAAVIATAHGGGNQTDKRPRSIFDLPENFFDSCRLLPPGKHLIPTAAAAADDETLISPAVEKIDQLNNNNNINSSSSSSSNVMSRWSCNTCKAEFESLFDQRSHFKSDIHRFNVKLSLAGKDPVKEDDLDELTSDSFHKDFDVSSISGSEDEDDRPSRALSSINETYAQSLKNKIFIRLKSGEKVSVWKSLLLTDSKTISCENDQFVVDDDNVTVPCLREVDVIEKLKILTHEPRDNTHFRIVLLASGGHFAGCVFDGNTTVAHKTFHRCSFSPGLFSLFMLVNFLNLSSWFLSRLYVFTTIFNNMNKDNLGGLRRSFRYVVRAKAGKRQSAKDGSGKSIHSAGASLRRYNELALKKDIQELLASWKPYFDASSCVFIYAPSNNRQVLYNGDTPLFSKQSCDVKGIPFSIRRPTLKEARRIYGQLSQVTFEVDEIEIPDIRQLKLNESSVSDTNVTKEKLRKEARSNNGQEACETVQVSIEESLSAERDTEVMTSTLLHEAAKSGNVERILELLEQGLDPTAKDERGRTPYTVATEKEARNTFRRFMASNLEKWDWHAANVPSPLTKEMEVSQAEKDAKRKAKAKEMKKLRKEREKKAQAKAAESKEVPSISQANSASSSSNVRSAQSSSTPRLSKEEELKKKLAEDREKRAAAAERRMAMADSTTEPTSNAVAPSTSQPRNGDSPDIVCSCCEASLVGKVPFHRYNYKYCSTTCMNVHREFLEDG